MSAQGNDVSNSKIDQSAAAMLDELARWTPALKTLREPEVERQVKVA